MSPSGQNNHLVNGLNPTAKPPLNSFGDQGWGLLLHRQSLPVALARSLLSFLTLRNFIPTARLRSATSSPPVTERALLPRWRGAHSWGAAPGRCHGDQDVGDTLGSPVQPSRSSAPCFCARCRPPLAAGLRGHRAPRLPAGVSNFGGNRSLNGGLRSVPEPKGPFLCQTSPQGRPGGRRAAGVSKARAFKAREPSRELS